VLRDHTVAVRNKVSQDIEHLWLEFARLAGTAEFIQSGVEFVVPKDVDHACSHALLTAVRPMQSYSIELVGPLSRCRFPTDPGISIKSPQNLHCISKLYAAAGRTLWP
jgi:hypothetical protein